MSDLFMPGLYIGLTIGALTTAIAYYGGNREISPEEYSYYDEYCLKAASTTKMLSFDRDDATLYCNNGAVFELNREQFKEEKQ